ncbi:asparagine synthase-related protein [Nocardia sp. NPDC051570]|uniref:asparagine synthase-related protein n=1 Tax=Nocardia sp. NPDC051570 TaxID=3364324 RepID=UPI0037A0ED1F
MAHIDYAGEWLVMLPDQAAAAVVAARLRHAPQRIDHPSGRPWLMGCWDAARLRIATSGSTSIAALGFCSVTPDRLRQIAARTQTVTALDTVALPGCYHLLATSNGVCRAQGSLSGLRRMVYATIGETTVAATRSDVLATLRGSAVDRRRLAVRLLISEIPLHVMNDPLWHDVHAVADDSCVMIGQNGRGVIRRRWEPPIDDQPMERAADALRTALSDAVRARLDSGLTVTADLSGGLDSTSLCFLAARDGRALTTVTQLAADIGDDDPLWADLAARHLPGIHRITVPTSEIPGHYSDILESFPPTDEPFALEDRPIVHAIATRLREAGSQLHLTGDGGDEALAGATGVFDLLRTKPMTALRYLRQYRALEHWQWRDIARYAVERRHRYPQWLAARARGIEASALDDESAADLVHMPPWATPEAVELARSLLLEEAGQARQHGHNWTAHHTIWGIRLCANVVRATQPIYTAQGVQSTSPFLDDAVIEACLAARAYERNTPWRYKPLLAEAMRGIVPEANLGRSTKAESSNLEYDGIRDNVGALAELCTDSRLAGSGLIDARRLREICTGFEIRPFTPLALAATISCERWLRDLEQTPASTDTKVML